MQEFMPLIMMVGLIAVMYFVSIRPQKKREKLVQEMLAALVVGDKILTIGGICGKIVSIKDDELVIETGSLGEPSQIKIMRWAIREVVKPADE